MGSYEAKALMQIWPANRAVSSENLTGLGFPCA